MAEVKFGKDGAGQAPVVDVQSKVEQVPTPVPGVTVPATTTVAGGEVARTDGERLTLGDDLPGFRDCIFPRINISQNIGELRKTFTPGTIVFDSKVVLFEPPVIDGKTKAITKPASAPANITVIGIISKRFSEKIVGGVGGMIVDSEAEVRSNGGTLDFKEHKQKEKDGMKLFQPLIDMLVAIRKPADVKDDDTVFGFAVGKSDKYALGLWAVKGTSYTHAFKKVLAFQRLAGVLKGGYPTHSFALSSRVETYTGGNEAHVPILVPDAKSTPEFMEFVKQIVNPTA
jgi:hypothetical protein